MFILHTTPHIRSIGLHTSIQKPLRLICLYTNMIATIKVMLSSIFTKIEPNSKISILKIAPIIGKKILKPINTNKIANITCCDLGNTNTFISYYIKAKY